MLLIAGVALPFKPGGFPIISLVGFIVMFGAGVLLLLGGTARPSNETQTDDLAERRRSRGNGRSRGRKSGGFSSRMEDRFRRRFEQE